MIVNHEAAKRLTEGVQVEEQCCYRNVCKVIKAHPETCKDAHYVEGYFTSATWGVSPHAWLELGEELLDVTPGFDSALTEDYFPVARFPAAVAIRYRQFPRTPLGFEWGRDKTLALQITRIGVLNQALDRAVTLSTWDGAPYGDTRTGLILLLEAMSLKWR